jgi:hypothetical protein
MADVPPPGPGIPGVADLEQLASTDRSAVYKGREGDQEVAVKVISADDLSDAAYDRFEDDARKLVALPSHPNLVEVRRAGYTDDDAENPYLIMEYLGGGSMTDRVAGGAMSWQDAVQAGIRLAAAVETAHRGGVVHGDISPANVLLTMYGEPKLAGFHIAEEEPAEPTDPALVGHAAPEMLEGAAVSPATDVYQLGSTLYTLLTGEHAFLRGNERSIIPVVKRVSSEPVPDLRARGVPDSVAAVVEQAMAKDPGDRFGSAEGFGRALQQAQVAQGVPVSEMTILGAAAAGAAGAAAATALAPDAAAVTAPIPAAAPPTAQMPAAPPPPTGPPPGAAAASAPGGPPPGAEAPKSKTPLIIGGVVALLLIAGLVFFLTSGGDDEESAGRTTTTEEEDDETTTTEDRRTTTTAEEVTTTTASDDTIPSDDLIVFSEEDLRIALFEAFQLPEGFVETASEDTDPTDNLLLCGVQPPGEAVASQVNVEFSNEASVSFIANTVVQILEEEAFNYVSAVLEALPGCSEDGLSVIDVAEGDLGDQMVIAEVVSDEDDTIGGFIILIRQFDVVNLFAIVSQPTPETDFVAELAQIADDNLSLLFD